MKRQTDLMRVEMIRIALVCATIVISACGGGSSPQVATPNATEMMAQAATGIAFVAKADALTATTTTIPTAMATAAATTATAVAASTSFAISTPVSDATATSPVSTSATPVPQTTKSAGATAIATATHALPTATVTPVLTATAIATETLVPTVTLTPAVFIDYTVVPGDTLLSIAFRYHVSLATLMMQNDINDAALINEGQVLKIPNVPASDNENMFWTVYVVQPGESLLQIAFQNDVGLDELVKVNKIADAATIQIGQRLILPVSSSGAVAKAAQPAAANKQVAAAAAPAPTSRSALAAPVQKAAPPPPPPIQAVNISGADAMRASLLAAYNQARASYGRLPLSLSGPLLQSAQLHAQDCAQRGYGSHVGSDGATTYQRIVRAGYGGRITGENWAWARTPTGAFDMWFNQETDAGPHRANILSARYTNVGFGIAAANGGYYFIADFGAP